MLQSRYDFLMSQAGENTILSPKELNEFIQILFRGFEPEPDRKEPVTLSKAIENMGL